MTWNRCVSAQVLVGLGLLLAASSCSSREILDESRQATGVKVGEVTPTSAIIWTRVTEKAQRRSDGIVRRDRGKKGIPPEFLDPNDLEGSVPGAAGQVRVRYSTNESALHDPENGEDVSIKPWVPARSDNDYTNRFYLENLEPATTYYFATDTRSLDTSVQHKSLRGQFETAPSPNEYGDVTFTVITGQMYKDADHADGFMAYDSMAALDPKFIIPTGDTVYYDSDDPTATSIELARYHWHRMYSYPKLIDFHLKVPTYFEKDDHDSYLDDGWPGLTEEFMGDFTFEQGLQVYAEQAPMSDLPYRTFRWGKGLQVWVVEGRDFRSPNDMPDGPEKTIWGARQKQWLKDTLLASDADWKVLISPTPIVGPDRSTKKDNHANVTFQHEGDEIRSFFQENLPDNLFLACGDRHWQYHSIHPQTKVHEFSSGPISDSHAGGTPGDNDEYHQFHRVMGGYLSVQAKKTADESTIAFRLHGVDGSVEYEYTRSRSVE